MLIRSFKVAVTVVAFVAVITHIANCITSEEDKMTRRIPSIISLSTKGLILPRLGLGTAALGGQGKEVVLSALQNGIQLLDTAQAKEWYDEKSVGDALREYRESVSNPNDVVIVTKVHPRSFKAEVLEASITESKTNLYGNTDTPLDVVLIHSPFCWRGHCTAEQESHTWQSAWHTLQELKKRGEMYAIGVSNFDARQLNELLSFSDTKVSVIQNWMDPFNQDKEIRSIAEDHGIVYMAYSSLGTQWEWKLKRNPVFTSEVLQNIADKHNTTISQVVLSWLFQEGVVAIPRSTDQQHIRENAAFMSQLSGEDHPSLVVFLDRDDMDLIESLDGSLGSLWD